MSWKEAERIKQVAHRTYPPGTHLVATYMRGKVKVDKEFFNPQDIPSTLIEQRGKAYIRYYLWSVKRV